MRIEEKAYAKINLFLEVSSKRLDGYHNIDSIMQTISLADDITIDVDMDKSSMIIVETNDNSVPNGKDNLVYKVIEAYNKLFDIDCSTRCFINKKIPVGAGLAGGSADAAAALIGINKIHKKVDGLNALCDIAKKYGADIPFCIMRGTCLTTGIGDIIKRVPDIPSAYIVVACGEQKKSTAESYAKLDGITNRTIFSSKKILESIFNNDLSMISKELYNAFEMVVSVDETIKPVFASHNCLGALMSGSGTSMFGIFDNKNDADKAQSELNGKGLFSIVSTPVFD